jgi:hypothetical protein
MSFRSISLLIPSLLAAATPVHAQTPMDHAASTCATPAELPAALADWRDPLPMQAASDEKSASRTVLEPGSAVTLALRPTPAVAYPLRPAKPGGSGSHGGLASFTVREAGTWRVALGSGAWVDVVKGGKAESSTAHGHGPECSGIRKMVDFGLKPGRYTLQIAASGQEKLTVLVTRLP